MENPEGWYRNLRVLRNKRDANRYQILVQIADHQPAVSQSEIAETLGITPQAVSEYLKDLVEKGHVKKLGRGRWEITPAGVDWLMSQTDDLREFTDYIWEEVIERGGLETGIATEAISKGERVSLFMKDGVLHAATGEEGPATAEAVTGADSGEDIGLTNFNGLLDFEMGSVSIIEVPGVENGGSSELEAHVLLTDIEEYDLVAVAGTEALVAARAAGVDPDLLFGTPEAVQEAALKGLTILLLSVPDAVSRHIDRLREYDIPYRVVNSEDAEPA